MKENLLVKCVEGPKKDSIYLSKIFTQIYQNRRILVLGIFTQIVTRKPTDT